MKVRIVFFLLASTLLFTVGLAVLSVAEQNKGAENITLDGGNRGSVPFPHHRHQEQLADCKICHSAFPQETGIIEKLKAEGQLKKKYVMNKLCTKCHKEKKNAGEKSGPTTCSKCHIKENS